MSWADTLKATALAALARRTAAAVRVGTDAPWNWNMGDVWLTRAPQPLARAAPSYTSERSTWPGESLTRD
jgi:hypothetical protein